MMNIMHLKYALEIARTGSLNKAAENLFMGQPNLSRAIKELENSLGITIFDRSAKGMVVTPEGEVFLKYAGKILAQIEEVEGIYKKGAPVKQKFSVCAPGAGYVADAFARFSKKIDMDNPAELYFKVTDSMQTISGVLQSEFKLGIVRFAEEYDKQFKNMLDDKGLVYELIAEFSYKVLMSLENPLAKQENISISSLSPYIEVTHALPIYQPFANPAAGKEELAGDTDKHIYIYERGVQYSLLAENPASFMWVSSVPEKILGMYELVQKSCVDNKRVYKDLLIYKRDYHPSELDNLFITELCNSKRRYL